MTKYVTLKLDVKVSDPQALWDTARDYLHALDCHGDVAVTIGSREDPNLGACCAMLLDRSEHLGAGAEVMQHEIEDCADDNDEESAGWLAFAGR